MTVTYTGEVATCRGFGCFLKLLFRWRGGIYKLVWLDLLSFLVLYFTLNFLYRFGLDKEQKAIFESISHYCDTYSNLIPLSFVLGFYVSIVMQRWWTQYTTIPFPDPIAVFVSTNVHGQDERGRMIRRTIMRYVCLCLTMVFTMISPRVKKRFPTLEHFVEAGLLLDNELGIIHALNEKSPRHPKHWLPIVWAASIVTRARKEGRIRDDFAVKTIIDELNKFRGQAGLLLSFDTISIPLVYTQVVTLAVYSFFLSAVMGRQWLEASVDDSQKRHRNVVDLYFPIFTTLQFFFYMGWLKVAESLINPFGEDDDDFEVNWMVDRNIQVSYLIVDEMHHEHPELLKDQYWDEVFPVELPHTVASEKYREDIPEPSTANVNVRNDDADIIILSSSYKPDGILDEKMGLGAGEEGSGGGARRSGSIMHVHRPSTQRSVSRMSSTRERQLSARSSSSINTAPESVPGSFHRVASVASVLKRMFSRDPNHGHTPSSAIPIPGAEGGHRGMVGSTSSASISRYLGTTPGILDQVIPEGDEQATVISVKPDSSRRPVMSIFQLPPVTSSSSETNATVISMPESPTTPESPLAPLSGRSSTATTDVELLSSQPGTPTLTLSSPEEGGSQKGSRRRTKVKERGDNKDDDDDDDDDNSDDDLGTHKDSGASEKRQRLKQKFAHSMGIKPSPKDGSGEERLLMNISLDSNTQTTQEPGSDSPEGTL